MSLLPIPRNVLCSLAIVLYPAFSHAQEVYSNSFGQGLHLLADDSSFYLKLGIRLQILYEGIYFTDQNTYIDNLQLRRFRLKFDGFAATPRLVYKLELGQSNRDVAGETQLSGNTARILLDAVLKYNLHNNLWIWFGQTKLPGNRERIISSQNLQFVDRSIVNLLFTLDRDLGVQLHNENKLGEGVLRQKLSVSMGEGRNISAPNIGGYDYTLRVEYLPFGKFEKKGDFRMSDMVREQTPKLSLGGAFDYNEGASRQRGQLGLFMIDSTGTMFTNNLTSIYADAILKYKGYSFMAEYSYRRTQDQVIAPTETGDLKYGTGDGFFASGAYLFKNNFEVAIRYSYVKPDDPMYSSIGEQREYLLGVSKYIVGHNLKLQSDISFRDHRIIGDFWMVRLQVELAF